MVDLATGAAQEAAPSPKNNRLEGRRIQLTTDGFRAYVPMVEATLDPMNVDFAQLQKQYGPSYEGTKGSAELRYSPTVCIGAKKVPVMGNPDPKHVSTSYAEENNLNIRMHTRRMTRLTNGFSKRIDNHWHAMALHFLYYNFVRIHQTLKNGFGHGGWCYQAPMGNERCSRYAGGMGSNRGLIVAVDAIHRV